MALSSLHSHKSNRSKLTPRALASMLLERQAWINQAGHTHYDPVTGLYKRDLFAALGYQRDLTIKDYRARYERGGIAEAIVEAYPNAVWQTPPSIIEDEDVNNITTFEKAVNKLINKFNLFSILHRAHILANLGRYSVLLIGAEGPRDQPLTTLRNLNSLFSLKPLAEDDAKIQTFVTNREDPRFGLPEFYDINLNLESANLNPDLTTHHSRLIHIVEGNLDSEIYGKPRLRSVWNYLDDLLKVSGGGAEAAWKRADPGMQIDVDPELELSKEQETELADHIDEFINGARRVMRTRGVDVNLLSTQVSAFSSNVDSIIGLISATSRIPQRILSGSERGELASTQDRSNWSDVIAQISENWGSATVRKVIDRFIELNLLPEPREEYKVVWPQIDELTEEEKAQVTLSIARANKAQADAGDTPILTSNEIRDIIYEKEPLEVVNNNNNDNTTDDDNNNDNTNGDDISTEDISLLRRLKKLLRVS